METVIFDREGIDPLEQDTIECEDIPNLLSFVVPALSTMQNCSQFSVAYNKKVFDGWVKQPSPCCGAASVAGAWNCLLGLHRNDPLAMTHLDVLEAYGTLFVERVFKQIKSFERNLGYSMSELLVALSNDLQQNGKQFGGKKSARPNRKEIMSALKRLAVSNATRVRTSESVDSGNVYDEIAGLFALDGVDVFLEAEARGGATEETQLPATEAAESEGESDADEEEVKPTPKAITSWDWQKDLMAIVKNLSGLKKLRADKPNTASIGNWAILQVVQRISEWCDFGSAFQARLFMGKKLTKKQAVDVPLLKKDDENAVSSQWNALRAAFSRKDTVLLFHLKNHYALIFALREWEECCNCNGTAEEGCAALSSGAERSGSLRTIRQLLCARKGQRPTAWVDFEEARATMLGWEGYKVMALTMKRPIALSTVSTGETAETPATERVDCSEVKENKNITAVAAEELSGLAERLNDFPGGKEHFRHQLEEELLNSEAHREIAQLLAQL